MEPGNEKFSFLKLVQRIKIITHTLAFKVEQSISHELLVETLLHYLNHPTIKECDENLYRELWIFSLEFCFKTNNVKKVNELTRILPSASEAHIDLDVINFLIELKTLTHVSVKYFTLKLSFDFSKSCISNDSIVIMINIFMQFYNDISESLAKLKVENSSVFNRMETGLIGLCSTSSTPESISISCKLLSLLESIELVNGKQDVIKNRLENIRF